MKKKMLYDYQKKTLHMGAQEKTIGILVVCVVLLQMMSYTSGWSKRNAKNHVKSLIVAYTVLIPFLLKQSSVWTSFEMQLVVTLAIVCLDWLSFHQDMTRFSEKPLCLFGNCRENSRITGHLAHVADAASVLLLLYPSMKGNRITLLVGFLVYSMLGSYNIEMMTKPGSKSDLREKTEHDACRQARIMRSSWRGGLNDLITVLGIVSAWQGVVSCSDAACDSWFYPWNQLTTFLQSNSSSTKFKTAVSLTKSSFLPFLMMVGPTVTNYINTSAQHGLLTAEVYGLPDCFDDEEETKQK